METLRGERDDAGSEALPDPELFDSCGGDPLESFAGGGWDDDLDDSDAGGSGILEGGGLVDLLGGQEGGRGALGDLEEFVRAAQSHLPKSRRKRSEKTLGRVTADDFEEGPPRTAFRVVEAYSRLLLNGTPRTADVIRAIEFFFNLHDEGGHEVTFLKCCAVLQVRPSVFRLRIQYEWWLRGTIFKGPFPGVSVPVPDIIAGQILFYGGEGGAALAREAWVQPGIHESELIAVVGDLDGVDEATLTASLHALEEQVVMSRHGNRWYVTGRNPLVRSMIAGSLFEDVAGRGGSIHWSGLFGR